MIRCYIGLGANLGNAHEALIEAVLGLEQAAAINVVGRSSIYRSAPMGPQDQPDYLNAVAALDTTLDPLALLDQMQLLEEKAGRVRGLRWGARTLDLDLLIYGTTALQSERLTLPHPGLLERNFVLRPLADIVGESWQFPDGSTLAQHLDSCPDTELSLTALNWAPGQPEAISA
ncbi:2-amino-4-hydroxy-6-hydroxymethyldihydropteridine diphosphokinase [Congregibacter sp.]|uniref:2-amino-4-hydroxy-6- hydroxymethyldihydropteridine diphosphokinase n=1 Tax=Congregibacter sp. TaxID=2744308 RepID=UPI003F6B663C